jgi:16S rRNA G1207 methylase RsmC
MNFRLNPPCPPPLPSEQLIIDAIDGSEFSSCLVVSPGRGQSGWRAKSMCPAAAVTLWYVDAFRASQAKSSAAEADAQVAVVCGTDLPDGSVDLALVAVLQRGEAEMTREILQQAHQRLQIGGRLIAAVNNPADRWLREQLQAMFDKVHCRSSEAGWVYTATKHAPLRKLRRFEAEFVFRDGDRLIQMTTRPSVFSHRSLDAAARLLITYGDVQVGETVIDFGCGSGAVGIASAFRTGPDGPGPGGPGPGGHVYCIDSNARAVQCATTNADTNGLTNVTAILNHDGILPEIPPCDVALLNPPYYGNFSIAEHFVHSASRLIRPGGRIVVVTKQADQYDSRTWPTLYQQSQIESGGYQLLTFRKSN